jgi:hypothetical protein
VIFFPLDQAAKKGMNALIKDNKLPLVYKDLDIGFFSASIIEPALYFNGNIVDLGEINVRYSPLSLISRKVSAAMENGFVAITAENTKDILNLRGSLDAERISKIAGQSANGTLNINFSYEYISKNGVWDAASDNFALQTPFIKVEGANLKANGIVTGNTFMIQTFSSEGDFPLTLEGQIRLDPVNIGASRLNLSGEVSLAGTPTPFALQGTISALKFSLK